MGQHGLRASFPPLAAPAPELLVQPLFPLALGQVQLAPDPLETALQIQAITDLQEGASSNPEPGCAWTGDLQGVWQLHRHPGFTSLLARIVEQAEAYLEALGFDRERVALHIQRSWPVVSELGQVVGRHHHPNAHLSAVYYLNGDGSGSSGCLRFWPPQSVNELVPGLAVGHDGPIDPRHPFNLPWFDLAPRAGLLVLFPSCLHHAVLLNEDEEDLRFSISVDFCLTAPRLSAAGSAAGSAPEYLAPHPSQWQSVREDGA
ncbi:MAG: TIGR02466 family protein [Cyanobacteriota bacterium]|jgi:uncharacterized protein (TIGR02466 family)